MENKYDLLKFAVENGIVDLQQIQAELDMKKNQELLNRHSYKIWQGKDGKWYTYLPDKEKGRILKKEVKRKMLKRQ